MDTSLSNTEPESTVRAEADDEANGNLAVLMDVQLPVSIRFGETEMVLEEIVKLGVGSVIELNSGMDQPVELVVNNRILARGEVVTVDGFYGIRITEITSAGERFKSLSS
jgi:flagellar motor switch protein FliN